MMSTKPSNILFKDFAVSKLFLHPFLSTENITTLNCLENYLEMFYDEEDGEKATEKRLYTCINPVLIFSLFYNILWQMTHAVLLLRLVLFYAAEFPFLVALSTLLSFDLFANLF